MFFVVPFFLFHLCAGVYTPHIHTWVKFLQFAIFSLSPCISEYLKKHLSRPSCCLSECLMYTDISILKETQWLHMYLQSPKTYRNSYFFFQNESESEGWIGGGIHLEPVEPLRYISRTRRTSQVFIQNPQNLSGIHLEQEEPLRYSSRTSRTSQEYIQNP